MASDDWTPSEPPADLRLGGEAMTWEDCDEMLACIAAILGRHRLNGETHAEMMRWKFRQLREERARLRYRTTDAALADHCPHCEGWANHPDAPCWWCGRITEAAAQARADAQKAATS